MIDDATNIINMFGVFVLSLGVIFIVSIAVIFADIQLDRLYSWLKRK